MHVLTYVHKIVHIAYFYNQVKLTIYFFLIKLTEENEGDNVNFVVPEEKEDDRLQLE